MIFLVMSIIAVIILVAVAIRRLPYLRPSRLGLEISSPRPYGVKSSPWAGFVYKVQQIWQQLMTRQVNLPKTPQFPVQSFTRPTIASSAPAMSGASMDEYQTKSAMPAVATTVQPGEDFWQDEPALTPGPLELPQQGLITRRGESQRIAQELIAHADEAFRKRDFKEAEKYYLQAATKDPDNARIYNRLGVIYLQIKNYRDAVEAFRRALKFDDRVASRHFNLALAYLGKRDYRSAEKGLREAIRLEPTNEKYRQTLNAIQKQVG